MTYIYIFAFAYMITNGLYYSKKTDFVQLKGIRLIKNARMSSKNTLGGFFMSLGGIMGAGNIVGVAAAINLGGAGAVLWMCVSAVVCSVLKYTEVYCAVKYKNKYTCIQQSYNKNIFGPLYYMQNIKGKKILIPAFCICCMLSSFTTGGIIQANAVSVALGYNTQYIVFTAVIFTAVFVAVSCTKHSRAVGFCFSAVPCVTVFYLLMCVVVLCANYTRIPEVLLDIMRDAFGVKNGVNGAFFGGITGMLISMRSGFSIGLLSHEAGLGTAAIAHTDCDEKNPGVCASLGILEVYADTLAGALLTALCLLVTKTSNAQSAFESVFGVFGKYAVTVSLILFALSSCVSWYCYGVKAVRTLNSKYIPVYIVVYVTLLFLAFFVSSKSAYILCDATNMLMLAANMVSLNMLAFKCTQVKQVQRLLFPGGQRNLTAEGNAVCCEAREE